MRKYLILLLGVVVAASWAAAETVSLGAEGSATPNVRVLSDTSEATVVSFAVNGFKREKATAEGTSYDRISLEGRAGTDKVGYPELPALHETIMIPGNAKVRADIVTWDEVTLRDYNVWPMQTPTTDYDLELPFAKDAKFYDGNASFPAEKISVGTPGIFRDIRVVELNINPFRYNPATKELTVARKIVVKLTYYGQDDINVLDNTLYRDPDFEKIYRDTVLNYRPGITMRNSRGDLTHPEILFVCYPNFTTQIAPLAEFYNKMGHYSKVVTTNETGNTMDSIKAYIQTVYDETSPAVLKYVFLVGDIDYIAAGRRPGYSHVSDYMYTMVNGGVADPYPDLGIGRFSTTDPAKVSLMVTKSINYQKTPPVTDTWLNNALLVAHQQSSNGYEACCEAVRTYNYNLFDPTFTTIYGSQGRTNADVSNAINSGMNVVAYRGHGSATAWTSWSTGGYSYTNSDFHGLNNGLKTPMAFNFCCDVADLDYGAETLCESEENAAYACVTNNGSADPSYTVVNHDYMKETFKAIYDQGILNAGLISNYANTRLFQIYGTTSVYINNVYMYLWLGDPYMQLWMQRPTLTLAASHPVSFTPNGTATYTVTVTDGTNPVSGALVALYKEGDIYCAETTNSSGVAVLTPTPRGGGSGTMYVTATKTGYLGYWGTCSVTYTDIKISGFTAGRTENGVRVEWNAAHDGELVGFNLYRRAVGDSEIAGAGKNERTVGDNIGAWVKVNENLIAGRNPYRFLDAVDGQAYNYRLEAVTRDDATIVAGPISVKGVSRPKAYALNQNYPNPARDATTISFALPEAVSNATVKIFDITGRQIKTLNLNSREAGVVNYSWNLTGDNGARIPAGVYVYRLETPNFTAAKRMVIAE